MYYRKGVTERLQGSVKKHDIRLYLKAGFTVRKYVVSPKDPLPCVSSVVSTISVFVRYEGRYM